MDLAEREWQAWQRVVSLLRGAKAVTTEDCGRRPTDQEETPGQTLFRALITWGDLRNEQGKSS